MTEFVDAEDKRRPSEFPRLSGRYRAAADVVWYPPRRRVVVKPKPVAVRAYLLDISVAGALLESFTNPRINVGRRIRFELNHLQGLAEIRNIRPSGEQTSYYGVAFFSLSTPLRTEVHDLVGRVRNGGYAEFH